MKTYTKTTIEIFVIVFSLIWLATRVVNASEDLPEWATEDSRTQAGGWIWFPGKGVAKTEIEADRLAKGMSIMYLIQECQLPHKDVRFNERFVEELEDGQFKVHVRASITNGQCNAGKNATARDRSLITNKYLMEFYREYRLNIAHKEIAHIVCWKGNTMCFENANNEMQMDRYYRALAFLERGCDYRNEPSCNMVGVIRQIMINQGM